MPSRQAAIYNGSVEAVSTFLGKPWLGGLLLVDPSLIPDFLSPSKFEGTPRSDLF